MIKLVKDESVAKNSSIVSGIKINSSTRDLLKLSLLRMKSPNFFLPIFFFYITLNLPCCLWLIFKKCGFISGPLLRPKILRYNQSRSSHSEVFLGKGVLEICGKLHGCFAQICCIFSEQFCLRTSLNGCFCQRFIFLNEKHVLFNSLTNPLRKSFKILNFNQKFSDVFRE